MKNIIIIGPPRCGKTTLAKRIVKNFNNFSIISEDNFRTSYISVCNDLNMDEFNLAIPTKQCFYYLEESIEYENDLNYVLDTSTYKETLIEKFKDNSIIIFIGCNGLTKEEIFNNIRTYDKETDWTYHESDYKVGLLCETIIRESKKYKEIAENNNYLYYDTSYDREKVLEKAFNEIKELIK